MKQFTLSLLTLVASLSAHAGFHGQVSFNDADRARHLQSLPTLLDVAARCLATQLQIHQDFYRRYGISAFYGDASWFGGLSENQQRNYLSSIGKDPELLDQMKPTSCVGLTRKCLGEGFATAGQRDLWTKIDAYTEANDYDGTAMQDALRKLGWRVFFWDPDTSMNATWDRQEARDLGEDNPARGWHSERWESLQDSGRYYDNVVDDFRTFVNFGTHVPELLSRVPFFVGTAHTGYHVFPGSFGFVTEGHSTRAITDAQTIEHAAFNPIANGGAPRGEYRSGLLAFPPGY